MTERLWAWLERRDAVEKRLAEGAAKRDAEESSKAAAAHGGTAAGGG